MIKMIESFQIDNGWVNPFEYDWSNGQSENEPADVDYLNDHNDGC
jgi:hypothetical protein